MQDMTNVQFQDAWFGQVATARPPAAPPMRTGGMADMMNERFQRGWFGPFSIPNVYRGMADVKKHVGPVFDDGPLDGLKTTSMWAQRMAQIPLRNFAQNPMMGASRLDGQPVSSMGGPVFCLPGHIPVPTGVPGQSRCVPYSPPSTMIGPQPAVTVSTMVPPAFPTGRSFPVGPSYWSRPGLGQAADPYLTKAERDKLLFDWNTSLGYLKPLEDLFAWSGDYEGGLRVALGADASRVSALMNSISPLYPVVKDVGDRMADTDAESWWRPSAEESAAMQQWLVGMSEMYRLLAAHRALPITLAPGMKAPPGFTNASPAPATQVIRPDGTVGPSKTSGIATKDLLLGGGIAVGLGILIYAVVS